MIKQQYESEFIGFKNELSSFIFRLLTNRQDTEDIVHDTYIKGLDNIKKFRGKSSLKTWVFSIALNSAKNQWKYFKPLGKD